MARLNSEEITIKISRMVRDNEESSIIVTDEFCQTLESVVEELVPGMDAMIEVEKCQD